ncbi:hypothetical protein D3C71_348920 [compost metagenome]
MPESHLNNILFVDGGSYTDVKKALRQWIDSYASQLNEDAVFKLYKNGPGNRVIQADESLDNRLFYYLVNYISYPVGIDYNVKVEGFTKGTEINKLHGKDLLVFLPEIDTEWDHVLIATEDTKCFKMDFGGKLSESSEIRLYQKPSFVAGETPEILKVRFKKEESKKGKDQEEIDRRFKWIAATIIVAHILNLLILAPFLFRGEFSFKGVLNFLFIAMALWFYVDYKILRSARRYLKCIALAFGGLIYADLISRIDSDGSSRSGIIFAFVFAPLVLLLIQWPLRILYILLWNREPIVGQRPEKFADMIYSLILFLGSMFISFSLGSLVYAVN